jgi:hypothetical protein
MKMFQIDVTDPNMLYLFIVKGFTSAATRELAKVIGDSILATRRIGPDTDPLPPQVRVIALAPGQEIVAAVATDDTEELERFVAVAEGEDAEINPAWTVIEDDKDYSWLDEKGFVFLDLTGAPLYCRMWEGHPWLFRWHSEQRWVSHRQVSREEVLQFSHDLSEEQQEMYHTLHRQNYVSE